MRDWLAQLYKLHRLLAVFHGNGSVAMIEWRPLQVSYHRCTPTVLIYIHGFNSSPSSHKARLLRERMRALGREAEFACPALPHRPAQAMAQLRALVADARNVPVTLVGSSLGGHYATYLVEHHDNVRAVLINPGITPAEGLRAYLGPQQNLYTGEQYELTEQHLQEMQSLYVPQLRALPRYLLIHATGDELLDYRIAQQRYAGARMIIHAGGDHGFAEFERYVNATLAFADER